MKPEWPALLAPGFHEMTLERVREVAVDAFPQSETRKQLFAQMCDFIAHVRQLGLSGYWWIDGSFLSEKPDPSDIDMVLFWEPICRAKLPESSHAPLLQLFKDRACKVQYNCDAYNEAQDDEQRAIYWRGVFGFSQRNAPKGVIILRP